MKDAELVLRFFALKDTWQNYSGSMKTILDTYLDNNKDMPDIEIEHLSSQFKNTIEKVEIIFGQDGSFRRWLPQNNKWKQQVSAPLFDSQMFSCYGKDRNLLLANKDRILFKFKRLFSNDETFVESIESSTGSPNRFLYRIETVKEIIR